MALKSVNSTQTKRHISPKDSVQTEEEGATVFILGSVSGRQRAAIQDASSVMYVEAGRKEPVHAFKGNAAAIETVKFGLRGLINFHDSVTGEMVAFETEEREIAPGVLVKVVTEAVIEKLGLDLVLEISTEINKLNSVTATEAKN